MTEPHTDRRDLLAVIDDLTLVKHLPVTQDIVTIVTDDEGTEHTRATGKTRKAHVTLLPLLDQLRDAIRSSIGGTAAGASLAHERSVLDADALQKAMTIASQIGDWCRIVGARHDRADLTGSLRAWYTARLATNPTEAEDDWYRHQLQGWVSFIWSKLDPIRERELVDAVCPVCGADEWWRSGERFRHPLVVKYRTNEADMIERGRAMCRACEHVWGVRELAYELERGADA